jgi:hypothetical protein
LKLEWLQKTANAAGTNGLTCLPKHGGARDNKFDPSDDWPLQTLLSFRDRTPSALTARPPTIEVAVENKIFKENNFID